MKHRARKPRRLRLESLESRRVLASVLWDGGGDGVSWLDPGNWENDAIPGELDDAIVTNSQQVRISQDITLNSINVLSGDLVIQNATVQLGADLRFESENRFLRVAQSTIAGNLIVTLQAELATLGRVRVEGDVNAGSIVMRDGDSGFNIRARLEVLGSLTTDVGILLNGPGTTLAAELLADGGIILNDQASIEVGSVTDATQPETFISGNLVSASSQSELLISDNARIVGNVSFSGAVLLKAPLTVTGDLTLDDGELVLAPDQTIEFGGVAPWSDLTVTGTASISSNIRLLEPTGQFPAAGETHDLVSYGSAVFGPQAVPLEYEFQSIYSIEFSQINNALRFQAPSGPDFAIEDFTGPAAIRIHEPFELTWQASLSELPFRAGWADTIFLSSDPILDDGDRLIGQQTFNQASLDANLAYQGNASIRLPNELLGDAFLIVETNNGFNRHPESNRANNQLSLPVNVGSDIDLTVSDFFAPQQASVGQTIELRSTIETAGQDKLYDRPFVRVTLSPSDASGGDDIVISPPAQQASSNDAVGVVSIVSTLDLSTVPVGDYRLRYEINVNQAIYESDYGNNAVERDFSVTEAAMVEVNDLDAPSLAVLGESIDVVFDLTNRSPQSLAARSQASIHLRSNPSEPVLASQTLDLPALDFGQRLPLSFPFTLPESLTPGDYQIQVEANDDAFPAVSVPIQVQSAPQISTGVTVRSLSVPVEHRRDAPLLVGFEVEAEADTTLTHELFFSTDPWYDPFDPSLGSVTTTHEPGSATDTIALAPPENVADSGFLILRSAGNSSAVDVTGTNLVRPISFTGVAIDLPNVHVRSLRAQANAETISGHATLVNAPTGNFTSLRVGFYATDAEGGLEMTTFLGSSDFVNLPAGSTATVPFSFPNASPAADFRVFASVNFNQVPAGTPFIPLFVESPDLVATWVEVPDFLLPTSSVSWSVQNASNVTGSAPHISRVFLSDNNGDLDEDDLLLGTVGSDAALQPGESETLTLRLDALASDFGAGNLIVQVSGGPDTEPADNTATESVIIGQPQLRLVAPTDPIRLTLGKNTIGLEIHNDGALANTALPLTLRTSSDGARGEDDKLILNVEFSESIIPAGQSRLLEMAFELDDSSLAHSHLLVSLLGAAALQPEAIELVAPIAAPNVSVSTLQFPTNPNRSRPIDVSWTVTNSGGHAIEPSWTDELYFSRDDSLGDSDVRLGVSDTPAPDSLVSGEAYSPSVSVNVQQLRQLAFEGSGFLIATSGNTSIDAEPADNEVAVAFAPQAIDLSIQRISEPQQYLTAGPQQILVQIFNLASAPLTVDQIRVTTEASLRDGGAITTSASRVTNIQVVQPIEPGDSIFANVDLPVFQSGDLTGDRVDISVQLEDDLVENNDANNSFAYSFPQIDQSAGDAVIGDFQATIVDAFSNLVELTWTVTNQGTASFTGDTSFQLELLHGTEVAASQTLSSSVDLAVGGSVSFTQRLSASELNVRQDLQATLSLSGPQRELSAQNNSATATIPYESLGTSRPVLTLLSGTETGEFSLQIRNEGERPLSAATGRIEFSILQHETDPTFGEQSFQIDLAEQPLATGQSTIIPLTAVLPERFGQLPSLFARVVFDDLADLPAAVVAEQTSNKLLIQRSTTTLAIDSFDLPSNSLPGSQITGSYAVTNRSSAPVFGWLLRVGSGENSVLMPINELIGSQETVIGQVLIDVPNLAVDSESQHATFSINASQNLADLPATATRKSLVGDYDLALVSTSAPEQVIGGSRVVVSWEVETRSNDRFLRQTWSDKVFLSEDDVLDSSDLLLATLDRSLDQSYPASVAVDLPLRDTTEQLQLLVVVDADQARLDIDRTNNVIATPLSVTASQLAVLLPSDQDTGVSDQDRVTSLQNPSLDIIVASAGTVSIDYDGDGTSDEEVTVTQPGRVSVTPEDALSEGPNQVTVWMDSDGGRIEDTIDIFVDSVFPVRTASSPLTVSAPWSSTSIQFSESVFSTSSTLPVTSDQVAFAADLQISGSRVVATFEPVFESGTYRISAPELTDLAGNPVAPEALDVSVVQNACSFTNLGIREDVNGDGTVTANDALRVINALSRLNTQQDENVAYPSAFFDVDCSRTVSALDALRVINRLTENNLAPDAEAELLTRAEPLPSLETKGLETRVRPDVDGVLFSRDPVMRSIFGNTDDDGGNSPSSFSLENQSENQQKSVLPDAVDQWMTTLGRESGNPDESGQP
ncbi:MAG: dockerin type I domain-containing protein [Rubripirellula sp.]